MTGGKILMLPGDGIGPEIMQVTREVINRTMTHHDVAFDIVEDVVGGAAIDLHGVPVHEETVERALQADCVLLGAVGGPGWAGVSFDRRPEAGLLELRKRLGLYANLRPLVCHPALVGASTLKPDIVAGLDIMIVRELTGGVYFGLPRGIETLPDGTRRGVNTHVYSSDEVERVARIAFEIARGRNSTLVSVDKSNVMEAGLLWREEVQKLRDTRFADIALSHMYADNCGMQLVRRPKQFDVILTDNLFGDLLSDVGAMLSGSLGMLPSASLGDTTADGRRNAMYEPAHGSAPDIAGQNLANPIAAILSFAMALRYTFDMSTQAEMIEAAIGRVLNQRYRTVDIMDAGSIGVSTTEMGRRILQEL